MRPILSRTVSITLLTPSCRYKAGRTHVPHVMPSTLLGAPVVERIHSRQGKVPEDTMRLRPSSHFAVALWFAHTAAAAVAAEHGRSPTLSRSSRLAVSRPGEACRLDLQFGPLGPEETISDKRGPRVERVIVAFRWQRPPLVEIESSRKRIAVIDYTRRDHRAFKERVAPILARCRQTITQQQALGPARSMVTHTHGQSVVRCE